MSIKQPLSPSSVNNYIKVLLEGDNKLKKLYIEGEASNVKYHSNGNIYFNIKDNSAQINCLMFKNYQTQMDFKLVEGDKIEILGNIYTYVKMGQYSINVFKMRKMGQGDLFQKYLKLKQDLEKAGYFNNNNKKNIPKFPKKIGVLTSDTGAAIRDIITTIKRRYPLTNIDVIPTLVQGKNAYKDIAYNIKFANSREYDVLIVGRGGGSIEDLWAFNEQEVAQAIYESNIPIISAVGHETDFTIADFVADMRAPTPTAAAEIATPNIDELKENLKKNVDVLKNIINNKLTLSYEKLNNIKTNQYFQNPLLNIETDFTFLSEKFINYKNIFIKEIDSHENTLNILKKQNIDNMNNILDKYDKKLNHQKENIDNLNPLTILSKGYSVVRKDDIYIKSTKSLNIDDKINIKLTDGDILAQIEKITNN